MAVLKTPVLSEDQAQPDSTENSIHQTEKQPTKQPPPLLAKLTAILFISCISFGSHWYSSVTSAMKSTLKKVLSLKQYIRVSEDIDCFGGIAYLKYAVLSPRSE